MAVYEDESVEETKYSLVSDEAAQFSSAQKSKLI